MKIELKVVDKEDADDLGNLHGFKFQAELSIDGEKTAIAAGGDLFTVVNNVIQDLWREVNRISPPQSPFPAPHIQDKE